MEAFINLTFKELCGSVEKCFGAVEGAGRDDGRGGEQGFYALLDLVVSGLLLSLPRGLDGADPPTGKAQMTGYVLPPSSRRSAARPNDRRQTPTSTSTAADPLASMFHALIQLDPQRMPTRTWEIVACLHECASSSPRLSLPLHADPSRRAAPADYKPSSPPTLLTNPASRVA